MWLSLASSCVFDANVRSSEESNYPENKTAVGDFTIAVGKPQQKIIFDGSDALTDRKYDDARWWELDFNTRCVWEDLQQLEYVWAQLR